MNSEKKNPSQGVAESGLSSLEHDEYLQVVQEATAAVRAISDAHPELDSSTLFHTFLNLKMSPEERLYRSLLRGGARKIFS